jgi:serine/threonine protein kinase
MANHAAMMFLLQREGETEKRLLKILSRQSDPDRRARMHREYTILRTLNYDAIPKAFDSNTDYYLDLGYKLFICMEYVDGETLCDSLENNGLFSLSNAVSFSIELLTAIEFCHSNGIIHRDIKPDNIILRHNDKQSPVLVDFGLSFNLEDESPLTPDGHIIGNRFLFLPELGKHSNDRNDIRSDLTMVVALLFYVLTGKEPGHLSDQNQAMPHQREPIEKSKSIIEKINHIFDVGFQYDISHRFQDVATLKKQLEFVLEPEVKPKNTSEQLRVFLDRKLTSYNIEKLNNEQMMLSIESKLNNLFFNVQSALKGMVSLVQIKRSSSESNCWCAYSFHEKLSKRKMICVKLEASLLGNQVRIDGGQVELHGIYTGQKYNIHRFTKDDYKIIDYSIVYEFLLGQVLDHFENSNNG